MGASVQHARGRLLTVDRVVLRAAEKGELHRSYQADLVDMESSAVAAVCREKLVRFLSIRVISDDAHADLPHEVAAIMNRLRVATASEPHSAASGGDPRVSRISGSSTSTRSRPPTGFRNSSSAASMICRPDRVNPLCLPDERTGRQRSFSPFLPDSLSEARCRFGSLRDPASWGRQPTTNDSE